MVAAGGKTKTRRRHVSKHERFLTSIRRKGRRVLGSSNPEDSITRRFGRRKAGKNWARQRQARSQKLGWKKD